MLANMSRELCLVTLRRTSACVATLAAIAMLPVSPAQAGGVNTTDCVSGWTRGSGGVSCVEVWRNGLRNPYVVSVPPPASQQDIADADARERLWQARCRPVIRQDTYGVRRYHYAAPGCEYGKYE